MEEVFDPYRKWLGIPPEEQPPNHYRLLGIALYETDPDVISNAADRQMAHVRTFQSGKRVALSQTLLNELSAAKICLLNPGSKREYDEKLLAWQSQLTRAVAVPVGQLPQPGIPQLGVPTAVRVAGIPTAIPVANPADTVAEEAAPTILTRSSRHKVLFPTATSADPSPVTERPLSVGPAPTEFSTVRPVAVRPAAPPSFGAPQEDASATDPSAPVMVRGKGKRVVQRSDSSAVIAGIVVVGLVGLLIIVLGLVFSGGGESSTHGSRDRQSTPEKKPPRSTPSPAPNTKPTAGTPPTKSTPATTPPPATPERSTPEKSTPEAKPEQSTPSDVNEAAVAADTPEKQPVAAPVEETPVHKDEPSRASTGKQAPPSGPALTAVYDKYREELEKQIYDDDADEVRRLMASQVLERAGEEEEPVNQYALCKIAFDFGAQFGDVYAVCEAVDLMATNFDVDVFDLKRSGILQITKKKELTVEDYEIILRRLQVLTGEALSVGNYEAASRLSGLAKRTSLNVRNPEAIKKVPAIEALSAEIDRLAIEVDGVEAEAKTFERDSKALAKDPNDAAANLSVARYWVHIKREWAQALPYLAKSPDAELAQAAKRDLALPKSSAEQIELAETWVSRAAGNDAIPATRLLERAKHWYSQAAQSATGAEKEAIEAKIAKVDARIESSKEQPVSARKETRDGGSERATEPQDDAKAADDANTGNDKKPMDETPTEAPNEPKTSEEPAAKPEMPATPSPADDPAPEFPD